MTNQKHRLPEGGRIERSKLLRFTFNGERLDGYLGDTLASALLANGIRVVGRSFKYHRPRGVFSSGIEEPNALVQLNEGARTEPNMQATRVELHDGLVANSQNCWPSVNFDLYAINNKIKGLLPAGFYYKTFKAPRWAWMKLYEPAIRRAAGMGVAPTQEDPDSYAHRYIHCDVLICGGGISGIAAALSAGRSGARVILVDDGPEFGGQQRGHKVQIANSSVMDWVDRAIAELKSIDEVLLLSRTLAASYYDHNMVILDQRVAGHKAFPEEFEPRHRLWQVRASEIILATGATERPLVFGNNDVPGVMLASATQTYANLYGIKMGNKAAFFTNNCSVYSAACDLAASGSQVAAIIDARENVPKSSLSMAERLGIPVFSSSVVYKANGKNSLRSIKVDRISETGQLLGQEQDFDCDLLGVSGGWTPNIHLHSQAQGALKYDEELTAFTPGEPGQRNYSIGAANGTFALSSCFAEGFKTGALAAKNQGFSEVPFEIPECSKENELRPKPLWVIPHGAKDRSPRFVDLQNDVKASDIELAHREGFKSVEHLKRYTTLGMGTDQGRTSNVNGLAIMAGLRSAEIPSIGTTTFRPPFSPIPLNAIAGEERGEDFAPIRRTPMHDWHKSFRAPFVPAGAWLRAQYYPMQGESMWDAIFREAKNVRQKVAIADVSPLGKIDLQGKDAIEFLNRLYINSFSNLAVGRCKYGVMLREDGHVFDDGTITRIGETHFMLTTTTVNAAAVLQHMEYWAQVEWNDLDVDFMSVTDEWAGIAVSGPRSRVLLGQVIEGLDLDNTSFPFMAFGHCRILGVPARLFRISFSGELAYELNVPADYGLTVWEALMDIGKKQDICSYGMEALSILRIEKGHVVGGELNGRTTPIDLGFGQMMKKSGDFIGKRGIQREGMQRNDRKQLVGLSPSDKSSTIPRGGQIVEHPYRSQPMNMIGEVTSSARSPNIGHPIGLGLVENAKKRMGETVHIVSPVTDEYTKAIVCNPIFFDPSGERVRG